ncbi:sugar transport protein MST1-like isoform X2 [Phragmites australis]|nr:sugar transport protein MST1-like isoform X2 [Phragmites australis]
MSRAMISLSCWCGSLPFFVSIGFLMSRLYSYIMIDNHFYGRQFILDHSANLQGESAMGMENSELCNEQPFLSSLLVQKRDTVRLALQCICYPASLKAVDVAQKKLGFSSLSVRSGHATSAFWRIMARNEQYLAYMMVLVALQFVLWLTRVNVTTLFLPMLSRTTSSRSSAAVLGKIVLILMNSCGILGSALATKQYGREVTFTISAILMVFCQVAIPLVLEVQVGVGGGTRMPTGYTTAMFALTCVVSFGLSWSWGSFFWTIPGKKVHSAGQVLTMALNLGVCFAQMQYFLLILCRLKNAILAYYAIWIWS